VKTLKTSFTTQEYCYYGSSAANIDFDSFKDEECVDFIQKYFKAGGKGKVIAEIRKAFKKYPERASHSVSAYMLGLLAYQAYQTRIDAQLTGVSINEFSHIWFLICLYHDYGYFYEKTPDLIKDHLCNQIFSNIQKIDPKNWNSRYDPDLIEAYFKLRKKQEHGTIAGALLRKRLNENLDYAISQNRWQDPNNFNWLNLHWSEGHREWYDFAASLIMKHNIWFANSEVDNSDQDDECKQSNQKSLDIYTGNVQLERLIIDNSGRMTFDENPLLFLLCMIDTIEPEKIGQRINLQTNAHITNAMILDIVNLHFIDNNLIIEIEENSDYNKRLHNDIYISAKRMETWMQLKVSEEKQVNILRTTIQW